MKMCIVFLIFKIKNKERKIARKIGIIFVIRDKERKRDVKERLKRLLLSK